MTGTIVITDKRENIREIIRLWKSRAARAAREGNYHEAMRCLAAANRWVLTLEGESEK